jgi:hypothetical protein
MRAAAPQVSPPRAASGRDVGITCGDSELRQTNPRANPLICLLMFLLSKFA